MKEINQNVPFLWRLSSQDDQGLCSVSLVIPVGKDGSEQEEHTIETRIMSFADELVEDEEEEVLEWNDDDLNLFIKLISSRVIERPVDKNGTIRVDLSDPVTIEVVQIVAAAGFGIVLPAEDYLVSSEAELPSTTCEIGSEVSINTIGGYKRCIIVDENDDEVVCVMLEQVNGGIPGFIEDINPYDLLLLKRHHILHSQYSSQLPERSDILH